MSTLQCLCVCVCVCVFAGAFFLLLQNNDQIMSVNGVSLKDVKHAEASSHTLLCIAILYTLK